MPIFLKAGLWSEKKLGYKGELNLSTLLPAPTLQNVIDSGNFVSYPANPDTGTASGMINFLTNDEAYYATLTFRPSLVELFSSFASTRISSGYIVSNYKNNLNVIHQILLQGGRIVLGSQQTYGPYNVQVEILTDDIVGDKQAGQLDRKQQLTNSEGKIPVYNTKTAPTAANSPGFKGEIRSNSSYVFICVADNTWIRSAITAW